MPSGIYKRTKWHIGISTRNVKKARNQGIYKRTAKIRKAISKATIKQWRDGKHDGQSAYMERKWSIDDGSWSKAISEGVSKKQRELWQDSGHRRKMAAARSRQCKISKPQRLMFERTKNIFGTALLEKPVGEYKVDIIIPDWQIAIEVDGRYWHGRPGAKLKDDNKDFGLWNFGWKVYRIEAEKVKTHSSELLAEIVFEFLDSLDIDPITLDILFDSYNVENEEKYARW